MIKNIKLTPIILILLATLLITISILSLYIFDQEKSSGSIINIAGKQRLLITQVALLSNNYYYKNSQRTQKEIHKIIKELKTNHNHIKNISDKQVQHLIYGNAYSYDANLQLYIQYIYKFLKTNNYKYLQIINLTNDSLVNSSNAIVEIFEKNYKKFIQRFYLLVIFLVFLMIFSLIFIFFMMNKMLSLNTKLKSINNELLEIQKVSKSASWNQDIKTSKWTLSKNGYAILGLESDATINFGILKKLTFKDDYKKLTILFKNAITKGKSFETVLRLEVNGELKYITMYCHIGKQNNKITSLFGLIHDITTESIQKEVMRSYIETINNHVLISSTDTYGVITSVSDAYVLMSGYTKDELIGKTHSCLRHPGTKDTIYKDLWNTIQRGKIWKGELQNIRKDASSYWIDMIIKPNFNYKHELIGYTAIRNNITDRKNIEKISTTDDLTKLYNRRHFNQISEQKLLNTKRCNHIFGFAILDIDNFKKYNDTYGHKKGDDVLKSIANALNNSFQRAEDIIFRLGGEEFCILFQTNSQSQAIKIVENARVNIEALCIEHEKNIPTKVVTASFGLVTIDFSHNTNDCDIERLYIQADLLLYKAKENGKNKLYAKRYSQDIEYYN